MPVIVRHNGLRVVMYPNDHKPIHVHVKNADGEVKVNALNLALMTVKGEISSKDIRQAVQVVADNQPLIKQKWREMRNGQD